MYIHMQYTHVHIDTTLMGVHTAPLLGWGHQDLVIAFIPHLHSVSTCKPLALPCCLPEPDLGQDLS